jgi:hypothetical protein
MKSPPANHASPRDFVVTFWLSLAGLLCWPVCFWWMHRISRRQDALLCELREQGDRIESLSREGHELIKDVHPAVDEIRQGMNDVKHRVEGE